jgi:hypothetical protein
MQLENPYSVTEQVAILRYYAEQLEAIMSVHRPEIDALAERLEKARAEAKQLKEMSLTLS